MVRGRRIRVVWLVCVVGPWSGKRGVGCRVRCTHGMWMWKDSGSNSDTRGPPRLSAIGCKIAVGQICWVGSVLDVGMRIVLHVIPRNSSSTIAQG